MPSAAEQITILKDVTLMIVGFVGMLVAVSGLNTWTRQLKGTAEYELARKVLRCTYRLRNTLRNVRNPMMLNSEMPEPPDDNVPAMSNEDRRHYGMSEGYQRRWDKVIEAATELQAELLEAEIIWNTNFTNTFKPLSDLQTELFRDLQTYIRICNPKTSEEVKLRLIDLRNERREAIYDESSEGKPDEFERDLLNSICGIEAVLKPHLRR